MLRPGAPAGFREENKRGRGDEEQEKDGLQEWEYGAFGRPLFIRSSQRIAFIQEEDPNGNPADKPDQADDRVQIPARQSDDHAERAAEEHQPADHDEGAKNESGYRRAPAARREFFPDDRKDQRAQDDSDNFWADILNWGGAVKPQSAGDIANETGDTETHIFGVPEIYKQGRDDADDDSGEDNKPILFFPDHIDLTPFIK